jgi:hypothetical protein
MMSQTATFQNKDHAADAPTCSLPPYAQEAVLLITCLRGLPYLVPHDIDWKALQDLAEGNRVLACVHHSLIEMSTDVPSFFTAAVQERRMAAESLGAHLKDLLHSLDKCGIDALPLKGPAMTKALYGDVALRPSDDLDLLVRREDFPRAEALLMEHGFVPLRPSGGYDRVFLRDGLVVELHFGLAPSWYFPLDVEKIWRRARAAEFLGARAYAMSKEDLVLYLCCHGLKHRFGQIIWILDLAQALQGWHENEYELLLRQARQQNLEAWLLIGCEVVRAMFPQHIPEALDKVIALSPMAERARRAAARIFSEDQETETNNYRSLYLQTESDPLKRLRYRLRYFVPTRRDLQWARCHHIPPLFMMALRPFRLLAIYGVRRTCQILFPPRG